MKEDVWWLLLSPLLIWIIWKFGKKLLNAIFDALGNER